MNKQKVNDAVLAYRDGNETAINDIFNGINPEIERASREVESYVIEFTKFDCRVVKEIKRALDNYDETIRDFHALAKSIIDRTKAQYIRRNSRKKESRVSMNALEGEEGSDDLGYQFEDPNENVENEIEFKEKVTLLAQGNPKQKEILIQWSKGADDKSISELLAQQYGGKAESHRKFITRFKTSCRSRLSSMS